MARSTLKVYEELLENSLCESDGRELTARKMITTLVHLAGLAERMNLIYLNDMSENIRDMIIDHNRMSVNKVYVPTINLPKATNR